jgi:hypothetical protein
MLLLGAAAFAIAHYSNAEPPAALRSLVDGARVIVARLVALLN